jgi:hypothetical protein
MNSQPTRQLTPEDLQSFQAGAKVLGAIPRPTRPELNSPVDIRRYRSVILDHTTRGLKFLRPSHLVGVLVDIERKQVNFRRHTKLLKRTGDVLSRDKRDDPLQAIVLDIDPVFQSSNEPVASINPESVHP